MKECAQLNFLTLLFAKIAHNIVTYHSKLLEVLYLVFVFDLRTSPFFVVVPLFDVASFGVLQTQSSSINGECTIIVEFGAKMINNQGNDLQKNEVTKKMELRKSRAQAKTNRLYDGQTTHLLLREQDHEWMGGKVCSRFNFIPHVFIPQHDRHTFVIGFY